MAEPVTPELLARLRRLHEHATPGPWEYSAGPGQGCDIEAGGDLIAEVIEEDSKPRSRDDAELIAETRNALPALLDEIERLRAQVEQLNAEAAAQTRQTCAVLRGEAPRG